MTTIFAKLFPSFLFGLLLLSCASENQKFTEREMAEADALVVGSYGDVDSLYAAYNQVSGRVATIVANRFFSALDDVAFTDTLIVYPPAADAGDVEANVMYWMCEWYYSRGKRDKGMALCKELLPKAQRVSDDMMLGNVYSLMASFYSADGNLYKALECTEECYRLNQTHNAQEALSSDLNNLAFLSLALGDAERARGYIARAIEVESKLDRPAALAIRYGTASETYFKLCVLDKAEKYARKALALDSVGGRKAKEAVRRSQLASILLADSNPEAARYQLVMAIPVLDSVGNHYSQTICLNQLGDIYRDNGYKSQAATYYREAYRLADRSRNLRGRQRASYGLWQVLKADSIAKAACWLERYTIYSDSINKKNTDSELRSIQNRFANEELELQNELLNERHLLSRTIWVSVVIILLVIILILLYTIRFHRKTNQKIAETERMRQQFFKHIASDFMPALTIINNLGHQLMSSPKTEDVGKTIERQSTLLLNLVKDAQCGSDVLTSDTSGVVDAGKEDVNEDDSAFINRVIDAVYQCMRSGSVTVDAVASKMLLSRFQLNRRIQAITQQTASDYILSIRLEKAKNLLKSNVELSVGDVANRCGFVDLGNFSRAFKQRFGSSPTNFRKIPD